MELLALSSYLLACLQIGTSSTPDHNEGLAYEASLKYYIMGSISSSFFLLGTSLVYAVQGSINFGHLIDTGVSGYSTYLSIIGFIFILFYFLFKLSIFPFHQWTPDVFQGVSLDVTAFLAILPKSTFYLLLPYIVFNLSLPLLGNSDGSSVLYALPFGAFLIALLSITLGSFMGLLQSNIKRIIAYSSITNGGFLLLGVSTNSFLGYNSYFFYLIVYLISNLNLFAAILWKGQSLSVLDFKSLVYRNPIYAANFLLILFSLAGIPPFAGFLAKFQIFNSLANYLLPNGSPSSLFIILFFALFLSLFASFYYLRLIHFFYFYEPNAPLSNDADIPNLSIAYLLSITSLAVIFFGIYPYPLIEFSNYLTFCLGWAF